MTRSLFGALSLGLGFVLLACSSSTPGRGVGGTGGGSGGGGGGNALCSSLSGTECFCSTLSAATGAGTGGACSSANIPNAVCCGNLQWPGPGLSCTCESYQCKQSSADGSCQCGNSTTGPTSTCGPVAGFTCCQKVHSYCECGPSVTCQTDLGDAVVTQCSATSAQCNSSSQKVLESGCQ